MAALIIPELPELPENGNATIPELPAPPIGAGRNGKREPKAAGPDLFSLEQQQPRTVDRKEATALVEVLKALRRHPAVGKVERVNSGAVRIDGRFLRFGWPGCTSAGARPDPGSLASAASLTRSLPVTAQHDGRHPGRANLYRQGGAAGRCR